MSFGNVYITSFAGTSLDTSVVCPMPSQMTGGRIVGEPFVVANGMLYDPNGTYRALVVPNLFTANFLAQGANPSSNSSSITMIRNLEGVRGTLVGSDTSGTFSVEARCMNVQTDQNAGTVVAPGQVNWVSIAIAFQPLLEWS